MKAYKLNKDSNDNEILEFFNLPLTTKVIRNKCREYCNFGKVYVNGFYLMEDKSCYVFELCGDIKNFKGPTWICFDCFKNEIHVSYISNRFRHRLNGPATIIYNKQGLKVQEEYCNKGRLHNRVGPAFRLLYNGVWINEFHINNSFISLEAFCKITERRLNESH
jgi:hypothetical protein